jgi:hypothetical protein
MDWLKLAVFLWLTSITLWVVRKLLRGDNHTVLFVLIGHWLFCGLPLVFDLTLGVPTYRNMDTLALAAMDPTTNLIYLAYIAFIPLVLYPVAVLRLARARSQGAATTLVATPRGADRPGAALPLYVLLVLPLFAVAISPHPLLYLTYGIVTDAELMRDPAEATAYSLVQLTATLAVIGCAALLQHGSSPLRSLLTSFPFAFIAMWADGKRHIVIFYLGLVTWRLWERKVLRGATLPLFIAGIALLFTFFTITYQASVRGISSATSTNKEDVYENARVDFGRDHTIKTAIYAELAGDSILGARGKSLLFYSGIYIPRAWWPEKPLPYSVYFTCYALGMPPHLIYWGLTTSIFDEAIANTGWFGMLLSPLFLGLLCRFADRTRNTTLRIMGFLCCMLFLAVNLTAFMWLFGLWIAGSIFDQQRGFFTFATARTRPAERPGR